MLLKLNFALAKQAFIDANRKRQQTWLVPTCDITQLPLLSLSIASARRIRFFCFCCRLKRQTWRWNVTLLPADAISCFTFLNEAHRTTICIRLSCLKVLIIFKPVNRSSGTSVYTTFRVYVVMNCLLYFVKCIPHLNSTVLGLSPAETQLVNKQP